MMSQILLFSIFCAGLDETDVIVFLEISNVEVHILRMMWQILMMCVSFFSIYKALLNKSNFYFVCSSPLIHCLIM